ncbi:MAG: terminase small subunit [Planctomycetaceae bacterium]|nr:terminase small subunit [Planctomycetaceae bacterium]
MATPDQPLDAREQRFVDEYVVDLNPERAAIEAGYSKSTARTVAYTWSSNDKRKPHVYNAIRARLEKRAEVTKVTADMVLARYWQIATADPNELIQYRRTCCRHCYGEGHAYQWIDDAEYERAIHNATINDTEIPEDDGGYGYNPTLSPHALCPKCFGEGHGQVHANDTRKLSPEALALYAGVKQTKEGFEIKTHDQLNALEKVARLLGMFKESLNLDVDDKSALGQLLRSAAGHTIQPVQDDD